MSSSGGDDPPRGGPSPSNFGIREGSLPSTEAEGSTISMDELPFATEEGVYVKDWFYWLPLPPDESDDDFQDFITYSTEVQSKCPKDELEIPSDAPEDARNRESYASFGDDGTTASVNAYGQIMQISRFLGRRPSGFFCVDLPSIEEPYWVQKRMEELMKLSEESDRGIGLNWKGKSSEQDWSSSKGKPSLRFVHDRWPRFTWAQSDTSKDTQRSNEPTHIDASTQTGGSELPSNANVSEASENSRIGLSLQYFCSGGVVFQQYTWEQKGSHSLANLPTQFDFNSNLLIRDLDFIDYSNNFNEKGLDDDESGYFRSTMSQDRSLVIEHMFSDEEGSPRAEQDKENQDPVLGVGLVMTSFACGKAQRLHLAEDGMCSVVLSEETEATFQETGILEITMAYRLQLISGNEEWKSTLINAEKLGNMRKVLQDGTRIPRPVFSSHPHLNFIIRRNLEHILSVCSIPVRHFSLAGSQDPLDGDAPVALTCGDISGHRVTSSASFFAFQFLLDILKHTKDRNMQPRDFLPPKTCSCKTKVLCEACTSMKGHLESLRTRIRRTCEAHIRWVCFKTQKTDHGFSPHYWATGDSIANWSYNYYLSPRSLTDTPFQIIKVQDYEEIERPSMSLQNPWVESLGQVIEPWISQLHISDKRGKYTFARPDTEHTAQKYNLADHVWMFRAIKSVEALELFDVFNVFSSSEAESYFFRDAANSRSEEFRRVLRKRFTTKNPHSGQRMLATSRNPSVSRFLLHSKDTALFYAMDVGFFDSETGKEKSKHDLWINKVGVWKETMDAQMDHEETQAMDWKKPLWYALALTAGSRRKTVNNKMSAEEMLRKAAETLLRISSPNGLFPGALDGAQKPAVFEDDLLSDGYWHTTFEIPLVFWRYGKTHLETQFSREQAKTKDEPQGAVVPHRHTMKKKVALSHFSNLIDQKRLVEVSDDWLAPEPTLVKFDFTPNFHGLENESAITRPLDEDSAKIESIAGKGRNSSDVIHHVFQDKDREKGVIIDVSRRSSGEEIKSELQTNRGLLECLRKTRTIRSAKKRLVWLPRGDKDTELLCRLASPEDERDNLSAFFERHAAYDQYFSDETTASLNEWVTELHFSYYRKLDFNPADILAGETPPTIPDLSCVIVGPQKLNGTTDTEQSTLARVGLGFRFVGDFFDRNWTCHFVEYDPRVYKKLVEAVTESSESSSCSEAKESHDNTKRHFAKSLKNRLSKQPKESWHTPIESEDSPDNKREKHPWQQRKVLELVLFNTALEDMKESTDDILGWVKKRMGVSAKKDYTSDGKPSNPSKPPEVPFHVKARGPLNKLAEALQGGVEPLEYGGSDDYFSINKRWQFYEQVLQTVEDDLSNNLEIVSVWSRRERDREPERPRWTRNDERVYRPVINKLQVMSQRNIRNLERLKTSIQSFRESLTGKLTSMREDINFRGSQNINLFTYVTVVFLPLGFATGIFSMSEAPGRLTLAFMVATAVVALSITFLALINAKELGENAVKPAITGIRRNGGPIARPFFRVLVRPILLVSYSLLFVGTFIRVVSIKRAIEQVQYLLRGNKHLRYCQVNIVEPVQVNIVKPVQINILKPVQVNVLKPVQINVLKPVQVNVLNPIRVNVVKIVQVGFDRFRQFDFVEEVKAYRKRHKKQKLTDKNTSTVEPHSSASGMDRSEETNGGSMARGLNSVRHRSNQKTPDIERGTASPRP